MEVFKARSTPELDYMAKYYYWFIFFLSDNWCLVRNWQRKRKRKRARKRKRKGEGERRKRRKQQFTLKHVFETGDLSTLFSFSFLSFLFSFFLSSFRSFLSSFPFFRLYFHHISFFLSFIVISDFIANIILNDFIYWHYAMSCNALELSWF